MSSFVDEIISLCMTGDYINGLAFKEADWSSDGLPIIRIQNLTNSAKPFNRTLRDVDDRFKVQNGDILVSWSATLDAFVWRRGPAVLNQHIFKVVPNKARVNPEFLFYQLKSIIWQMSHGEHAHGSTMKHINRKPFLSYPFWCPALSQQREIALQLDRSFSGLESCEKQLRQIQAKLKQARASILKAAVEGRLTSSDADLARWIENQVQPSAGMPPKDSDSDKTNRLGTLQGVPSGWSVSSISDLTSLVTSGSRGWSRFYSDVGAIFVRSQDINTYKLELKEAARVSLPGSIEGSRARVKQGDLLLIITGANVTVSARVEHDVGEAYVSQHVALCRPRSEITSAYLHLWLMAPGAGKSQLESSAYGAGKPGLNLENIRSISVLVPPLPEQVRIVAEVDRRFSVLDQVEATVQASLARCGKLRQAILKRAFEGRLVPAA